MLDDERVGELLRQDRRDADGQLELDALVFQVVEGVEQRDVGLGDGLVDPLLAVRPHAGLPRVRKVAVQDERERTLLGHRCHSFG